MYRFIFSVFLIIRPPGQQNRIVMSQWKKDIITAACIAIFLFALYVDFPGDLFVVALLSVLAGCYTFRKTLNNANIFLFLHF